MSIRRMLPFILVNILVSAAVVLALLFWWDNRQADATESAQTSDEASALATVTLGSPAAGDQSAPNVEARPTADDEDGPTVYVVKSGDTLGSIGIEFDVTVQDIMAANNLDNADFLSIDQELIIPIGGIIPAEVPEPDLTSTPEPDVAPTPIPTIATGDGDAVMEIGEVIGLGILSEEAVSVANTGSSPISLDGWRLEDEEGQSYTFGRVTLFGEGAAISVYTGVGENGPTKLYWGLFESIWQEGETVTLYDADGLIQVTFTIGSA